MNPASRQEWAEQQRKRLRDLSKKKGIQAKEIATNTGLSLSSVFTAMDPNTEKYTSDKVFTIVSRYLNSSTTEVDRTVSGVSCGTIDIVHSITDTYVITITQEQDKKKQIIILDYTEMDDLKECILMLTNFDDEEDTN